MENPKLLVHADASAIRCLLRESGKKARSMKDLVDVALEHFSDVSPDGSIALPVFNYDFAASRLFDVRKDKSQVGAIAEFARSELGWKRNGTPVFSFICNKGTLGDDLRPFEKESVLGSFHDGGNILLFGVGFEVLTFLHVAESESNAPYRYNKRFDGKVRLENGQIEEKAVEFHVRPKGLDIDYDFHKLGAALLYEQGAWKNSDFSYVVDAELSLAVFQQKFSEDPLFALTEESRTKVKEKLDQLGRPFDIGDFE